MMLKLKAFFDYTFSQYISVQIFIIKLFFKLLFDLRLIGSLTLIFIAFFSLFKWNGAELTNQLLVLCGFIFLASRLSEIKNWNFFNGFIKGETKDISLIPETGGINTDRSKPTEDQVNEAENEVVKVESEHIHLMPFDKGNFLELAFNIERLLRVLATVTLEKDIPSNKNPKKIVEELHGVGMITDVGKQQIEAIRWLRNLLVHGRESEINPETLSKGIQLAYSLYTEISNWLNTSNTQNARN